MRDVRSALTALSSIDSELKRRISTEDPITYGMPNLLRVRTPEETEEQFASRQNGELREFIEGKLWAVKDTKKIPIRLAPAMIEFIADLFFKRVNQAILWKGRGTGGSLCTSILIWLALVYHKMSFTSMAGSSEQAKNIYHYTKGFWNCFPELSRALLAEEPLQSETRLTNGVMLKIISASEKQARGKHNPGFIVDESCQEGDSVDRMITAGMQGAMSESNYMVVVLSTFHHPIGLFQEIWDFAEERGFKRYFWNIYDAMEKCDHGMETATEGDPEALAFCREQCPLTGKKNVFNEEGVQTGWKYVGCEGKARHSLGFFPRKNVIMAKKMNRGTNVFEVEYENERPNWMRPVYEPEWIEVSEVDPDFPGPDAKVLEKSVGIDWGLEGQTALILAVLYEQRMPVADRVASKLMGAPPVQKFVAIIEAEFMTGKLTGEAIRILMSWVGAFGQDKFYVYADVSHPFNNLELEQVGFDVRRVPFAKWKDYGIGNCTKYLTTKGRLFIRSNLTGFIEQMKRYRQDRLGKPVKKDDHGPDAFLCAMLHYLYEERFKEDMEAEREMAEVEDQNVLDLPRPVMANFAGMSPPSSVSIGGVAQPLVIPAPIGLAAAQQNRPKKKIGDGNVLVV